MNARDAPPVDEPARVWREQQDRQPEHRKGQADRSSPAPWGIEVQAPDDLVRPAGVEAADLEDDRRQQAVGSTGRSADAPVRRPRAHRRGWRPRPARRRGSSRRQSRRRPAAGGTSACRGAADSWTRKKTAAAATQSRWRRTRTRTRRRRRPRHRARRWPARGGARPSGPRRTGRTPLPADRPVSRRRRILAPRGRRRPRPRPVNARRTRNASWPSRTTAAEARTALSRGARRA